MEIVSLIFSLLALVIAGITAWLTLLKKGEIRMTQPTLIYFGPDGNEGPPKVFLRTLLYSTSKRGQIIQNMFVKLQRGESKQTFNVWVYGDSSLARGSGLFVGVEGIACNHHFLLPKDGTQFEFLPGDYTVEVYVSLVGQVHTVNAYNITLTLSESHAKLMQSKSSGVYFDWGPDSKRYSAHVDERQQRPPFEPW